MKPFMGSYLRKQRRQYFIDLKKELQCEEAGETQMFQIVKSNNKNINFSSSEIAMWRSVVAFIILSMVVTTTRKVHEAGKICSRLWMLLGSGAPLGFNWVFLFEAYRRTSVALSSLCNNFASTLVVIGSIFLFAEKLRPKQILCFIASSVGWVLAIGISSGGSNDMAECSMESVLHFYMPQLFC